MAGGFIGGGLQCGGVPVWHDGAAASRRTEGGKRRAMGRINKTNKW